MGKKIFFINPPNSLRDEFLEYIFKNEFELYLLDNKDKIEQLLEIFHDAIVFINIDTGLSSFEWTEYINHLHKKFSDVTITVFSKLHSNSLQKTYLMDIGINGGYIIMEQDNWKTIEIINKVLEVNEARGRRKNVRIDFKKNESRCNIESKVFTTKGYLLNSSIRSVSSAGLFVNFYREKIESDDNIEKVVFSLGDTVFNVTGYLMKKVKYGLCFISFEDISSSDKEAVQQYIFNDLQKSFKQLLKSL